VLLLGTIGALMFKESLSAIMRKRSGQRPDTKRTHYAFVHGLPLRTKFRASKLYISAIPPFLIGVTVGILSAIMGVGGGFLMVPAMIYVLGMPTKTVIGTSLFQITFMASFTTVLHAIENQTVDLLLGVLLILGGVIGAQIGARIGQKLNAEMLRVLLAVMVLMISGKVATELLFQPSDLFSLTATR
jgi:hypothetical protein